MMRRAAPLLALVCASPLHAQRQPASYFVQHSSHAQPDSTPHVIQWYEVAGAAAGIVALMFVDESVQRWAQDVRSETTEDFAAFFRHFGQPEVWVTVPTALILGGLLADNAEVAKAGGRAAAAVALGIVTEVTLKFVVGRARPD